MSPAPPPPLPRYRKYNGGGGGPKSKEFPSSGFRFSFVRSFLHAPPYTGGREGEKCLFRTLPPRPYSLPPLSGAGSHSIPEYLLLSPFPFWCLGGRPSCVTFFRAARRGFGKRHGSTRVRVGKRGRKPLLNYLRISIFDLSL